MTIDRVQFARFLRSFAPLLLTALAACASDPTEPSPEMQRAAWEAQNVYPQNYRAEILAYMRIYLNDPRSVREAAVSEPALRPMGLGNRYVSCLRYNLSNTSPGYPSGREHIVIYVGGKLDAVRQAKDQCAGAVYASFPDLERITR
jgi:hypothetical protein